MTASRHWLSFATVFAILVLISSAASIASAQDQSPDEIQTTRTARQQTDQTPESLASTGDTSIDGQSTDAPEESSAQSANTADIDVEGMDQTIAQGLAAFDAFPVGVWRITELKPLPSSEAPSVTAPYYGFLYQMDGVTIVRNDVTGKRARLEPGEAYFFSANDAYTRYREESASRTWLIEIVPEDSWEENDAGTVIFHTGEIGAFPQDTRDLELTAANVLAGGTASVADFQVDALIMVTVGSLDVTDAEGTIRMDGPAGLLVTSDLEIENVTEEPAVYLIAKIGPSVADVAPAASPDEEADSSDGSADPMLDTDGDTLIDTDEAVYGTDPAMADTDFDGYSDGDEVIVYGTDPLDPNSYP